MMNYSGNNACSIILLRWRNSDAQHTLSHAAIKHLLCAKQALVPTAWTWVKYPARGYIHLPQGQTPSQAGCASSASAFLTFRSTGCSAFSPASLPSACIQENTPRHLCLQKMMLRSHSLYLDTYCYEKRQTQAGYHHPTGPILMLCPP